MNLELDGSLGAQYRSKSQWARRVTEGWAQANLYCVACTSDSLAPHAANRVVEDYHCPHCSRRVQLKAEKGGIGKTVSNSAFERKRAAILAGRAPDYCFMGYDGDALRVMDLLWVPGHFMTMSVVSKRTPLGPTARRAGWVGSSIHLDRVPEAGKIPIVRDGVVATKGAVRRQFSDLAFLRAMAEKKRRWVTDVLACLDTLQLRKGSQFQLLDVYTCEEELQKLHPDNRHIRPKIRQQLQMLVAAGLVQRIVPGTYRRL